MDTSKSIEVIGGKSAKRQAELDAVAGGWWQSDSTNRRVTYEVEKFAESYPLPYTLICALFGRRTRRTRYNLRI